MYEEGILYTINRAIFYKFSFWAIAEKDGFEVCERLKNDERSSHIPIILLTAKADVESRIAGLSRGADAYLKKPFHRKELLVILQNLFELRKTLQARYANFISQEPTTD